MSSYNFTYLTQKYELYDILDYIFIIFKYDIAWRDLCVLYKHDKNIYWNIIYKHFIKLSEYNIFKDYYIGLIKKYFYKIPNKKLKIVYTDTAEDDTNTLRSYIPPKNSKHVINNPDLCYIDIDRLNFDCYDYQRQ